MDIDCTCRRKSHIFPIWSLPVVTTTGVFAQHLTSFLNFVAVDSPPLRKMIVWKKCYSNHTHTFSLLYGRSHVFSSLNSFRSVSRRWIQFSLERACQVQLETTWVVPTSTLNFTISSHQHQTSYHCAFPWSCCICSHFAYDISDHNCSSAAPEGVVVMALSQTLAHSVESYLPAFRFVNNFVSLIFQATMILGCYM